MIASAVLLSIALLLCCTWGLQNLKHGLPLLIAPRGRFRFDGGPEKIENNEWDVQTREIIGGLENLGFKPLGMKVESFLHGTTLEIAFASPEKLAFASIHGFQRGHARYYFYTPFEDGAVVVTSGFQHAGVRTEQFTHTGSSAKEMSIVLDDHEKNVQEMARPGRQPCRQYDQEARLRATEAYYQNPGCRILTRGIRLKRLRNAGGALVFLLAAGAFAFWKWLPFLRALRN
jgi:hypothetical protein